MRFATRRAEPDWRDPRFHGRFLGLRALVVALGAASCLSVLALSAGVSHPSLWIVGWILLELGVAVDWMGRFAYVVGAVVLLVGSLLLLRRDRRTARLRGAGLLAIAVVATALLARTSLPRRACFRLCASRFDALLARVPEAVETFQDPATCLYSVSAWGRDPRGGAYFLLRSPIPLADLLGDAEGFAHRPNPEGTPFGDRALRLEPLVGDWCRFRVSDE